MKKALMIGIDTGSSSTKVSLFDVEGQLVRESSFQMRITYPAVDQAEIPLEELFRNIVQHLRELVKGYEDVIHGIGLSVASPTLVFFRRDLEALRPGIAYFDNRSKGEVTAAVARFGGAEAYFGRVGNNPSPSTCVAATVQWVRAHEPELWKETYKIGFLNSYLGGKFTGRLAVDPTVASYSGMVRVETAARWEREFLDLYGIDEAYLPEIAACMEPLGGLTEDIARSLNLPAGLPVAIGSADTAASSFALGVRRHGDVFQSMGTSEVAVFCLDRPDFSPAFMNRSHVIPGVWLANGAMSMAGGSIRWFLREFAPELSSERELEELACTAPPGANGVLYVPYLCGERSPIFDAQALGLFFGLTAGTSKADLARAVYEGLGHAMAQIYRIGTTRWNVFPPHVICIGGATRSDLSIHIRANMQNVTMRTVETSNAAAFGAAMMGGMAAGVFHDLWDVPVIENYRSYVEPDAETVQFYDGYQEVYEELYPALVGPMHRLSRLRKKSTN